MKRLCLILTIAFAISTVAVGTPVTARTQPRVITQRQRQIQKLRARLLRIRQGDRRTDSQILAEFAADRKLEVLDKDNFYDRAQVYYRQGKFDRAVADATSAIALQKDFVAAFILRGRAYASRNNVAKAVADFNTAVALQPDRPYCVRDRGDLYFALRRYREARDDYDTAVGLGGATAEIYFRRANASFKLGDYAVAIADYDRALELKPDFKDAETNRALARQKKGASPQ